MEYIYKTKGTCSKQIKLNIEGNIVTAIPALVNGLTVEEIEKKLSGIQCGFKQTSCGDQLAKACREAYECQINGAPS